MNSNIQKLIDNNELDKLITIHNITDSLCKNYDTSLTTYATLSGDKTFSEMPDEMRNIMDKRSKIKMIFNEVSNGIEYLLIEKFYE